MDYREYSKDLLVRKKNLVSAYSAIKTELDLLDRERCACKSSIANAEQNGGDASIYEERLINVLADLDDCRFRRSIVERELLKIEKGMNVLSEYQRDLLERFYVSKEYGAAEDLMEKWYKERSCLYRDKIRALDDFTRSVYGVLQL